MACKKINIRKKQIGGIQTSIDPRFHNYDPGEQMPINTPVAFPNTRPQQLVGSTNPQKIDPYFTLRRVSTGLQWLSGKADRNRQDQYMYNQLSTLGQIDPVNINDYQPTNYNPYFQQGGAIKVTNPNDPRLKAYQDSLSLYENSEKVFKDQREFFNTYAGIENASRGIWDKLRGNTMKVTEKDIPIPNDWKVLKDPIKPIGAKKLMASGLGKDREMYYYDAIYKKPVQPVEYQKQGLNTIGNNVPATVNGKIVGMWNETLKYKQKDPELQRLPYNPVKESYNDQYNLQGVGAVPTIPQPDWKYRVEYTDPETGQSTHQMFPNERVGSDFQRLLSGNRTGYWQKKQKGGPVDFEKNWINSKIYQSRNVPTEITNNRINAINTIGEPSKVSFDYLKSFLPKGVKGNPQAMYNSDKHIIEYANDNPTVMSHEYFHGTTKGDLLIPKSENINSEERASLQNLRYGMYQKGIPVLDREINQEDLNQMKDTEEYKYLKNMFRRDSSVLDFLKSTSSADQEQQPIAKKGGWIQKAVNPEHKGYCTPMTKATCTPRRKALAMTFKKHHGFHKKD